MNYNLNKKKKKKKTKVKTEGAYLKNTADHLIYVYSGDPFIRSVTHLNSAEFKKQKKPLLD